MWVRNVYEYKGTREVENVHTFRYGSKSERGKKRDVTPEEMKEINERNAVKKLRRKIHANFGEDDIFLTFTYKQDAIPDPEEAKKRLKKALDKMRSTWKKEDDELKYIIVTEYMNKRIHHHLIVNDLPDGTGAKKLKDIWKENGSTNIKYLYSDGWYERLAAYLVKETNKHFRDEGNPSKLRYSCSRNLVNPEKKTRIMKSDDWPENPKVPKGYELDKESLVNGINKMGYRYQYYRLLCQDAKCHSNKVNTKSKPKLKGAKNESRKRQNHRNKKGNADHKKNGSSPAGRKADRSLPDGVSKSNRKSGKSKGRPDIAP